MFHESAKVNLGSTSSADRAPQSLPVGGGRQANAVRHRGPKPSKVLLPKVGLEPTPPSTDSAASFAASPRGISTNPPGTIGFQFLGMCQSGTHRFSAAASGSL